MKNNKDYNKIFDKIWISLLFFVFGFSVASFFAVNNFNDEKLFSVVNILLQLIIIFIAWRALSVWKYEIRGREQYKQAKEILEYVSKIRFLIYSQGGAYSIVLNDIFNNKDFYSDQLVLIRKNDLYFNSNIMNVFKHIDTRSDFFLSNDIRDSIYQVCVTTMADPINDKEKGNVTYIELSGINKYEKIEEKIYKKFNSKVLTVEEYFKKWENLVRKLQKIIHEN